MNDSESVDSVAWRRISDDASFKAFKLSPALSQINGFRHILFINSSE